MESVGGYTLEIMSMASWYNKWLFSLIDKNLKGEILEVGAGIGNLTGLLKKKGKLTAIDVNKGYIRNLKKNFGKEVSSGFGDIETGEFFFNKKKFNTIVCFNVLEHIKNHEKALFNMHGLLKENGDLFLLAPACKLLFSRLDKKLGHYRRYSKGEIVDLLEKNNFEVISIKYVNWLAAIGWFIFVKLGRVKNLPKDKVSVFDKLGRILLFPERFFSPIFGLSILVIAKRL